VAEPYLNATIRPDILFPAYLSGFNLAESFYMAMPFLSWQTVVIGDPLCAPFRAKLVSEADIESSANPVTELPGFLSERRIAALTATGVKKEAAEYFAKGEAHDLRQDAAGARAAFEQATSVDPSMVVAQMTLASLYEADGAWDSAIARYRTVIERNPNDSSALNNLAYALATRKDDPAAALPFAKRAYKAPNSTGAAADTLAWVQHLLGNDAEALPLIAAAAKQLPNVAEVRLHAAFILAGTGNLGGARDELELALKLDTALGAQPSVENLRRTLGITE
jgi:Tfp pilus assembly protein PilF